MLTSGSLIQHYCCNVIQALGIGGGLQLLIAINILSEYKKTAAAAAIAAPYAPPELLFSVALGTCVLCAACATLNALELRLPISSIATRASARGAVRPRT